MKRHRKKRINYREQFDKMSFESRESLRARLKKERVYTKSFRTPQSFGAASEVRHVSIDEWFNNNQLLD